MTAAFTPADWLALLMHFMSMSLLAIGGAITTAPGMHGYLVGEKTWLSDSQFTSSIALAQVAPGPNVLFVALLGWNVGMNAGGGMGAGPLAWWMALAGVLIAHGDLEHVQAVPVEKVARLAHRHRQRHLVLDRPAVQPGRGQPREGEHHRALGLLEVVPGLGRKAQPLLRGLYPYRGAGVGIARIASQICRPLDCAWIETGRHVHKSLQRRRHL